MTGGSGSEIKIDATKRVRHRDAAEGKRLLEALRIDINNFNGRVEVRTIYPRRRHIRQQHVGSVDYVIAVPAGAAVAMKSISGNISVSNVSGEVRAETVSGDVNISATPNVAVAKTMSGDVLARDIGTQTTLVLSTVSGTVIGTGLRVRALEAGSVSGDVRLIGSEVERLEARSVSGNIEFDAPLAKGGRYEFTSHSGNVRIVLSRQHRLRAGCRHVQRQRPIRRAGDPAHRWAAPKQNRRGSTRAIRGTYGDASAILSVRSHSGSVVITKK